MPSPHASICVLMSGGLDSAFLLSRLRASGCKTIPLYVRCGLRWEKAELHWLCRYLNVLGTSSVSSLRVIDVPLGSIYSGHWGFSGFRVPGATSADKAVYLPGRNVLLLSIAAIECVHPHTKDFGGGGRRRIHTIALGILRSNPFGDASGTFLARF